MITVVTFSFGWFFRTLKSVKLRFSRRIIALSMGFVLFLVATDQTARSQEAEGESSRRVVTRADPVYPELARKMNLEGAVKMIVTVAPNGYAKSVRTIGGNPVLVKAAEDAVNKYRWVPAQQDSTVLVEMKFHRP